jgi:hypothetical protein
MAKIKKKTVRAIRFSMNSIAPLLQQLIKDAPKLLQRQEFRTRFV